MMNTNQNDGPKRQVAEATTEIKAELEKLAEQKKNPKLVSQFEQMLARKNATLC